MTRLHRSAALVTTLVFTVAACGGGSDSEPADTQPAATDVVDTEPDDTAPAATEPADSEPADTEVPITNGNDTVDSGRCGEIVGDGEYESVDCDEPHDAEFAGTVALPGADDSVSLMAACSSEVEALTGRPSVEFGIDVGAVVIDGDQVECWAEASGAGTLSASILDDGLDAAIGEFVFITDLPDGSCFIFADEDSFDFATVVDCDDPSAEMLYGQFEADDGPAPDDATTDGFFVRCDELEAAADIDVIGNERYLLSPLTDNWEALDRRTVLCIAANDSDGEATEDPVVADPAGAVGPVCATYDEPLGEYPPVPCDEPHDAEYAGSVAPPAGDLPADADEASIALRRLCRAPVEQLTGRDLSRFGVGVGFVSIDGLGEPMVNDIRCYVSTEIDGSLIGAIGEIGYDAALQPEIIAELPPGTCFVFIDDDSFDLGEPASCDAPDALMAVGSFVIDAPPGAPHPGDDALRALRAERCGEILATSGLAADPSTVSGTFPGEKNWVAFDRREVTCDATPL